MYHDENSRDHKQHFNPLRRGMAKKLVAEKKGNYSPSASYNYSPGNSFSGQQHSSSGPHHHIQRRNDNFKRDRDGGGHQSDRLAKQNDTIIRLLKEIRDRLPAPVVEDEPVRTTAAEAVADNGEYADQQGVAESDDAEGNEEQPA